MAPGLPTQLYLIVDVTGDAARIRAEAEAMSRLLALPRAKGLVSAVLLEPVEGTTLDARIAPLIEAAQSRGTAALLFSDARLARTLRADGVHLAAGDQPMARYGEAREILGNRFIVGADAGRSRHDAMMLGEAGADYLAFGSPGRDGGLTLWPRLDLVEWWAEIFEVPCVATGSTSPAEVHAAAAAGADFVAVRLPAALSPDDAARWLDGHADALAPLATAN